MAKRAAAAIHRPLKTDVPGFESTHWSTGKNNRWSKTASSGVQLPLPRGARICAFRATIRNARGGIGVPTGDPRPKDLTTHSGARCYRRSARAEAIRPAGISRCSVGDPHERAAAIPGLGTRLAHLLPCLGRDAMRRTELGGKEAHQRRRVPASPIGPSYPGSPHTAALIPNAFVGFCGREWRLRSMRSRNPS